MEFHEDLSVRPSWMPPSATQPPLRLLDWWESSLSSSSPGDMFFAAPMTLRICNLQKVLSEGLMDGFHGKFKPFT